MKYKIIFLITFSLMYLCSITSYAQDYFLFDAEKNQILMMGDEETSFTEKLEIDKVPDIIMKTDNPDKFLVIYGPEINEEQNKGFSLLKDLFGNKSKAEKEDRIGQLILFNTSTGRTEDLIDLGYGPFFTAHTEDYKHFFIIYKLEPEGESYELYHYNISEMKGEKIPLPEYIDKIWALSLTPKEDKLLMVINRKIQDNKKQAGETYEMVYLEYAPLSINPGITIEHRPRSFYS